MPILIAPLLAAALAFQLAPGGRVADLARAADVDAGAELDAARAPAQAVAALIGEAETGTPAEELLAVAFAETRYDATHRGGLWGGRGRYCGALQATAPDAATCALWGRDVAAGYVAGGRQIGAWRTACARRRGPWSSVERCALAGYGGGWGAVRAGRSTYPARVLGRAARIRRRAVPASPGS